MVENIKSAVRKFDNDEAGMEALQVVMIIAIAAMVMIACATVGKAAVTWMNQQWQALQGEDVGGQS